MNNKQQILSSGAVFLLCAAVLTGALAMGKKKPLEPVNPVFNSWLAYWDLDKTESAARELIDGLDHVCLFAVSFNQDGRLASGFDSLPEIHKKVRSWAFAQKPIYLTAVNDVFTSPRNKLKDPDIVHDRISTPENRAAHIDDLLKFAEPFDGIEIDYENMNAADRDDFSVFIKELAKKTHEQGKKLSVVVEAKTNDAVTNAAGAIDWKTISKYADTVKIMAYYFHYGGGDPGPIAPPDWISSIVAFANTEIPAEKICVALVMNGIDWPLGKPGKNIDYDTAKKLMSDYNVPLKRDRISQCPYFQYNANGQSHTVWFDDALSLGVKVNVLKEAGVANIALWRLGSGDLSFWRTITADHAGSEPVFER